VQDILSMDLIGAEGEEIGDVERVISQNGELFVVVGNGGFLGLGEKQVALPLADMTMRDGELYTRAYTEDEVEEMAEFDMTNVDELPMDQTAEIGLFQ
ncbi:MAG: PRC-barrel domain-containing protein, partial [Pseudomonadota bacterium]